MAGAGEEEKEGAKWTCGCDCGKEARCDKGGGTIKKRGGLKVSKDIGHLQANLT